MYPFTVVFKLLIVMVWLVTPVVYAEALPDTQQMELSTSSTTDHQPAHQEKHSECEKKFPNYVHSEKPYSYATEPTVEKISILGWELKIADVIALIVVLVGFVTIFAALLPVFLEYRKSSEIREIREQYKEKEELKKELKAGLQDMVEEYSRQVDRVIDKQAGRHEERLLRTQIVLNKLWDRRATEVGKAAKEERLDVFLEAFRKQLNDELTFGELLSTDKVAVFNALGKLKDIEGLPIETVTLLRLLYKQGRIEHDLTEIVREILDRWGEPLTDDGDE